ncbi:ankyrin repeat-containing protein ITN1-like [Neltuma alba]|uniref:ankyrin repeat-containing protein ITN1-like n=1 Tax=Neltuma alba TaxID=207710 RepID=UPI0010A4B7E0|nr:ankyrin repeat-containing protein ITN1-like [Prosopis alba]
MSEGNQQEQLRSYARRGEWSKVFETYKQERTLRIAKITGTGDTLLHMAVSHGEEHVVAKMVDLLVQEESWNVNIILGAENDRKNTPLHLAAKRGSVEMCKKIGGRDPLLIAKRNTVGETPIFLAALYGRRKAFLWLYYMYMGRPRVSSIDFAHCIRDNHDTILHCAIAEGHFDVAIEIVYLYKYHLKEMMKRNKEGLSPLHLLAAQRSAFESTALLELSIFGHPIYWLSKAKEKNRATSLEELQKRSSLIYRILVKLIKFIHWLLRFLLLYLLSQYFVPENWKDIRWLLLCVALFMLLQGSEAVLGRWFRQIRKMKEKHKWSLQIMNQLLRRTSDKDMSQIIWRTVSEQLSISLQPEDDNELKLMTTPASSTITIETPLMIAVKNGAVEMVEKILELFPSSIKDVNLEGKNIVLLAAEYRQTKVYRFLWKQKWLSESLFWDVDKEGNNALHLAARLGVEFDWLNPGETLLMSGEINWFELVKNTMPRGMLETYNQKMETPDDIFKESHKEIMKHEGGWVAKTSQACSVVSTLVASVAFATRDTVPGGYNAEGFAILRNKPVFKHFVSSSIAALFFSLISTIFFLSIVASRSQSVHFWRYLPLKLYWAMFLMFYSIACLWISFCSGGFFMFDDDDQKLRKALPIFIFMSSMIVLLVITQLPTFFAPILSAIPAPRRKRDNDFDLQDVENFCNEDKWSEVLERCKKNRELRTAKKTDTEDTVLHIVVSHGKEQMAESMVDFVCGEGSNDKDGMPEVDENGDEKKRVIGAQNADGN